MDLNVRGRVQDLDAASLLGNPKAWIATLLIIHY